MSFAWQAYLSISPVFRVSGEPELHKAVMRVCITLLLLGLACHAHGTRELKWGWSSASSLGQLSTTTGANSNSGLLSTCAHHNLVSLLGLQTRRRIEVALEVATVPAPTPWRPLLTAW